jgi:hypothetical protein
MGLLVVLAPNLVVLIADPGRSRACEPLRPVGAYMIDPALRDTDSRPPQLNKLSAIVQVADDQGSGCGPDSKCRPPNTITFGPAATDDFTAPQNIGYRIIAIGAGMPLGLVPIGSPTLYPVIGGEVVLYWTDAGAQPFDFMVSIVAIDRAGNESAEQLVRIRSDAGGGCSVALRARLPTAVVVVTFALLAAATTLTRRRPRSRG